ncbi:dna repair and recombination rhm52 [Trichoderma cornu-damae]|uniref:RAD52 homolog n=1 Tax=Trichoderma cornu-damae TaxID=654480 RepID=A0A9P8QTR9_9HYPO|nr:dna repair and recombination rhm52 [Trichoderma cornu-damae]
MKHALLDGYQGGRQLDKKVGASSPGDQHQAWANPFEEARPRVSEWTAKEIATISSRLDKQLGPEYISSRSGPGGSRVHYLTAEKVIGLANEVFGFNGWSSSIQNIQVDFADENPQTQRVSIGLSVIVRVTLRDGTYHEDVGYGSIENAKGKAMAFEKAKKEGTTDALKRTLRNFGNVLGNCIYDQDYVRQVTKIKPQANKKFDPDNLHRHSDFVNKDPTKDGATINSASNASNGAAAAAGGLKIEPMDSFDDFLGELDEADFCVPVDGHPDEITLPNAANLHLPHDKPSSNEPRQGQPPAQPPAGQLAKPVPGNGVNRQPQPQPQPHTPRQGQPPRPQNAPQGRDSLNSAMAPPQPPPGEPVAFFSARSTMVDSNQSGSNQNLQRQLFDPKAESPSIRKTPGIDHTSSKPVARNGQHVPPANSQAPSTQGGGNAGGFTPLRQSVGGSQARGSMTNPSLDQARRIGAPGGLGSPLANRGQYKPPTMKRTLPSEANGPRAPLLDIPANAGPANDGDGLDAKRQKVA